MIVAMNEGGSSFIALSRFDSKENFVKKWLIRLMAVLAILSGGILVAASPAAAASPTCNVNNALWIGSGGGWGQWRYCQAHGYNATTGNWEDVMYFQVDDTLTDTYQVHLEITDTCCSQGWQDFDFQP